MPQKTLVWWGFLRHKHTTNWTRCEGSHFTHVLHYTYIMHQKTKPPAPKNQNHSSLAYTPYHTVETGHWSTTRRIVWLYTHYNNHNFFHLNLSKHLSNYNVHSTEIFISKILPFIVNENSEKKNCSSHGSIPYLSCKVQGVLFFTRMTWLTMM